LWQPRENQMRKDVKLNTPGLMGGSELVVMAPIKPGFVPALDSVTYKTRAKLLLKALHSGRRNSHEFQLFRALSDAVERIGVIHTVRVAVLEPENKIMLSVNVDGSYEAYVRVIWQKSARLLDLIFCNTEDHVTGWDHSYEQWSAWLRRVQVEIPFFYAPPNLTAPDQTYLRMLERYAQRSGANELASTQIAIPPAEQIAWDLVRKQVDPQNGPQALPPQSVAGSREAIRQGLQGLVGLYRLADLYPPGTPDGIVLHRAARELLPEFSRMQQLIDEYGDVIDDAALRFPEPVAWLARDQEPMPAVRVAPALPSTAPPLPAAAQGGILEPYKGITHGALCLLAFDDAAAAAEFLNTFPTTGQGDKLLDGAPRWNIAFTMEGLRCCGLPESALEGLPMEFRLGMEQRAGILGDVRGNHPRRWRLPLRNGPQVLDNPDWQPGPAPERVNLEAVHAVIQLRLGPPDRSKRQVPHPDLRPKLAQLLKRLFEHSPGARPLSVQWMERLGHQDDKALDHFGFIDGQSQPELKPRAGVIFYPNQVHVGETLLGYPNAADHDAELGALQPLLMDGSFLVIRKLSQDVKALDDAVNAVVQQEAGQQPPLTRELVLAKMMGRWHPSSGPLVAGLPLVTHNPAHSNDFNYQGDPQGAQCPFSAHVRRSNPRPIHSSDVGQVQPLPGDRPARLVRRGMPYGAPYQRRDAANGSVDCPADGSTNGTTNSTANGSTGSPAQGTAQGQAAGAAEADSGERGLMFMAYNSSIAEQFETVQRWLSGGNSSGAYSGATDPFLGVPESGRTRMFRFEHGGRTVRMALDGTDALGEEPRPLVALEWGSYLLAPSKPALSYLRAHALQAASAQARTELPWSVSAGAAQIQQLQALERQNTEAAATAWKAALEDPDALSSYTSASIWAAIRAQHGGVLRIPYGVLVADRALVNEVLSDASGRYTVSGYQQRLQASIGAIYLGLDAHGGVGGDAGHSTYAQQSKACNDAIMALSYQEGFDAARQATRGALMRFVADTIGRAMFGQENSWELNLDIRELLDKVLGSLCTRWFGLHSETGEFQPGGFQWNWKDGEPPLLPGHFNAPSRYTFQPAPGPVVERVAIQQGQALAKAMVNFLSRHGATLSAPITRAVLDQNPPPSLDLAARTLTGAIMGFVPTTDGSLRRVVQEWMRDGTLWALRAKAAPNGLDTLATAKHALLADLKRAMQTRPVPEQIWRTATRRHELGQGPHAVHLQGGDTVVLALVSATQQALETGREDVSPIFGGNRHAAQGAPTHACPAYPAAMGAMLGVLSALVDWPAVLPLNLGAGVMQFNQVLRAGPALGVLSFGGDLAVLAPPARPVPQTDLGPHAPKGRLLTWGDSWIVNPYPQPVQGQWDYAVFLRQQGYSIALEPQRARAGMALSEMAAIAANDPDSFYSDVRRALIERQQRGTPLPRAIVLDGGGNDVHRGSLPSDGWLSKMLNRRGAVDAQGQALPWFKEAVVLEFIDGVLAGYWQQVLDRLTGITQGEIPILVHGYDHPIPDGRAYFGNWLERTITGVYGYDAQTEGRVIMKTLIDRLNHMLEVVTQRYPSRLRVHHVKLTGTLAAQPGFEADYTQFWVNELHPNDRGFAVLAQVMDRAIAQWGNAHVPLDQRHGHPAPGAYLAS
jgi:deferrochelatase/peroxidase EfeB